MPHLPANRLVPLTAARGGAAVDRGAPDLPTRRARPRVLSAVGLLLAGALLAGCSPAPDAAQPASAPDATADTAAPPQDAQAGPAPAPEGDATGQATDDPASPPATGAHATIGGDGSDIRLDPLGAADIEQAALGGELACSFVADGGEAPLLLAMGVVASDEPAQGVVKVAGYVEPVRAPGGFDGMLQDPTFSGQGKTVRIALTGEASGGGESPPRPATLTYLRADGASRTFEGQWQCGP